MQSRPEGEAQRETVRRSFASACLKAVKAFPVSGTRKRGRFHECMEGRCGCFLPRFFLCMTKYTL